MPRCTAAEIYRMLRLTNPSPYMFFLKLGAEQLIWSFSTHREEDQVVLPVSFARAQQQKTAFEKIIRLKIGCFLRYSINVAVISSGDRVR